jgi:DNA-binding IclR family transcriptional regulator
MARPSPQTDRIVAVINFLAVDSAGGATLSEIARRLRVSKATCYPMLAALTDTGFLSRHPTRKTFHLGPALIAAGRAAAERNPLLAEAREAMIHLGDDLDLTAWLLSAGDEHLRVVDQAWHSRRVTPYMRVGEQIPLSPPRGALFLAWSTERAVARWFERGSLDEPGRAYYLERLADIRESGYAISLEEVPLDQLRSLTAQLAEAVTRAERARLVEQIANQIGDKPHTLLTTLEPRRRYSIRSIDAPIFDDTRRVSLALGVTNLPVLAGKDAAAIVQQVCEAAERLSRSLPSRS